MTEKHAKQPVLCSECETMARATAEQAQPDQMIPWICEHNGVVAMGYMRGNVIETWNNLGPVTADQARAAIQRMLAEAEGLGMTVNPTKKQQ